MINLITKVHNFLTKNKIAVIIIILIGLVSAIFSFLPNIGNISLNNINSNFNQSPQCTGENCQQIITYNQEVKSVYVSPEKKLIKANFADYSFPLKIVNEKSEDINDVALIYSVPGDYGIYRIMIDPKDKTEIIRKYNDSLQIMLPGFGWQDGDKYIGIAYIESIYRLETKEYQVTVNTRDYNKDFFIEFGLLNLSEQPELKKIFKGFGVE